MYSSLKRFKKKSCSILLYIFIRNLAAFIMDNLWKSALPSVTFYFSLAQTTQLNTLNDTYTNLMYTRIYFWSKECFSFKKLHKYHLVQNHSHITAAKELHKAAAHALEVQYFKALLSTQFQ